MKIIDLYSDTATLPTPAMRKAMYSAEVGDDGRHADPTVNRLEEMAAERMGNLVSHLTHCTRGDETIMGHLTHTLHYEVAGMSGLAGVLAHIVPNKPDGTIGLDEIEAAIHSRSDTTPRTRLVWLENTHNLCGGAPLTPEYTGSVCSVAKRYGLAVHLDGERIFNAAIALGVDVKELTRGADSVMFGLAKGLSCPVGSVLCGTQDFISEARRNRRMVGGGMRQAGIIAAAGVVALEQMIDRLADDHRNARRLADGLAQIKGLTIDAESVRTNLVYFHLTTSAMTPSEFVKRLSGQGVIILDTGICGLRAVTHYGIEEEDVDAALAVFRKVLGSH